MAANLPIVPVDGIKYMYTLNLWEGHITVKWPDLLSYLQSNSVFSFSYFRAYISKQQIYLTLKTPIKTAALKISIGEYTDKSCETSKFIFLMKNKQYIYEK